MEKELSKFQQQALLEKWNRIIEVQKDFNWFMEYVQKELGVDETWEFDRQTFKKFVKREVEEKT